MKRLPARPDWELGATAIAHLLPQQAGMRHVDGVRTFTEEPLTVTTHRFISADHPVFRDHFPELPLWPGVFTIEGMAQTIGVAVALRHLVRRAAEAGLGADFVSRALQDIDDAGCLGERPHQGAAEELAALTERARPPAGVIGSVQARLLGAVPPGVRLDFRATVSPGGCDRFAGSVHASVADRPVAEARITVLPVSR